ncbi:hypothetical protein M5K25_004134 [Dendrobium thyrsiflorum]|uniref:Uncharacterized protein n=1 Tax=Dendrobium thyrsiflorum TaxID=117978 RepID=A0ABD0VKV9_DENTH
MGNDCAAVQSLTHDCAATQSLPHDCGMISRDDSHLTTSALWGAVRSPAICSVDDDQPYFMDLPMNKGHVVEDDKNGEEEDEKKLLCELGSISFLRNGESPFCYSTDALKTPFLIFPLVSWFTLASVATAGFTPLPLIIDPLVFVSPEKTLIRISAPRLVWWLPGYGIGKEGESHTKRRVRVSLRLADSEGQNGKQIAGRLSVLSKRRGSAELLAHDQQRWTSLSVYQEESGGGPLAAI